MVWSYTTKDGEFTIKEWSTCFEIVQNETGLSQFLGDGVDLTEFQVGTPEFYAALSEDLEHSEGYWRDVFDFTERADEYPYPDRN